MADLNWKDYWKLNSAPQSLGADFREWLNSKDPQTRAEILADAPPEVVKMFTVQPPPVVPQTSTPPKEWYQVGYAPPIVPHRSAPIVPPRKIAQQKAHKKRKSYLWLILLAYALLIVLCLLPGLIYHIH